MSSTVVDENEPIDLGNATAEVADLVVYAYIKKGKFEAFPAEVLKNFPNIYNLNFYRNSINQLTAKSFENGQNLKYVDLRNNQLTSISADIFRNLPLLSSLYISNNQIAKIDDLAFAESPKLVYIDARSNNLTNINFVNVLPNIAYINVESNLIREIDFSKVFFKLTTLYIQSNEIEAINPVSFYNAPSLQIFDFSFNQCFNSSLKLNQKLIAQSVEEPLKPCYEKWYEIYPTTTAEIVTEPPTTEVPTTEQPTTEVTTEQPSTEPASIEPSTEPTTIEPTTEQSTTLKPTPLPAQQCNFYIDRIFGYTCALTHVHYQNETSGNFRITGKHLSGKNNNHVNGVVFLRSSLARVPDIIFKQFKNLTHLDISHAEIKEADENTFGLCGKLQYLDASGNDIERIGETFLSKCKDLEVINLNNNLIDSISPCGSFLKRQEKLKDITVLFNKCIDQYFYHDNLIANYDDILAEPFYQCFVNFLKPNKKN